MLDPNDSLGEEASAPTSEARSAPSLGRWLSLIPAAIAGMLALVYALGSIAVYGQVKDAGLSAVQTMPLVPVEQILGRGIASIASIFSKASANALISVLFVVTYWPERHTRRLVHPSEWSKRLYLGMPGAILVLAIFLPWETAAVLAVGALTMLAIWAIGGLSRVGGSIGIAILACGSVISLLPMSVASSLIEPPPLPKIAVVRSSGPTEHGGLVAETGSNWYVAHPDHSVDAIPNARVAGTTITYPKRDHATSLWDLVF
jgi:hypothetical protein